MPNRALRPRSRFQVQRHSVSEFVKEPSRAKRGRVASSERQTGPFPGPGFPPERRTVSPGAKRSTSPEGVSLMDETSNRSVC